MLVSDCSWRLTWAFIVPHGEPPHQHASVINCNCRVHRVACYELWRKKSSRLKTSDDESDSWKGWRKFCSKIQANKIFRRSFAFFSLSLFWMTTSMVIKIVSNSFYVENFIIATENWFLWMIKLAAILFAQYLELKWRKKMTICKTMN